MVIAGIFYARFLATWFKKNKPGLMYNVFNDTVGHESQMPFFHVAMQNIIPDSSQHTYSKNTEP